MTESLVTGKEGFLRSV